MYTEYVFVNKKYEVIDKNLKANIFDVVAQEKKELTASKSKEVTSDSQDKQNKLFDEKNKCLDDILVLADDLSNKIKMLDSYTRDLKFVDNKDAVSIVANVHEDSEKKSVAEDTIIKEPLVDVGDNHVVISEESMAKEVDQEAKSVASDDVVVASDSVVNGPAVEETAQEAEPVVSDDAVVASDSVVNGPAVEETAQEAEPVADNNGGIEEVVPISNDLMNNQPLIPNEGVISGQPSGKDLVQEVINGGEAAVTSDTAENIIPEQNNIGEVVPISGDSTNNQALIPTVDVVPEQSSPESMVQDVASNGAGEPVVSQQVDVVPAENAVIADAVPAVVAHVQTDNNMVDPSTGASIIVFIKNDANPTKAILTTGSQVSKLRASRDGQSSIMTASGFFKTTSSATGEIASGSVTQAQIEELMAKANELYQAGNIEESQNLYNQISQLSQNLKQSEAVLVR